MAASTPLLWEGGETIAAAAAAAGHLLLLICVLLWCVRGDHVSCYNNPNRLMG